MDICETYLKTNIYMGVNDLPKPCHSQMTDSGCVPATSAYYHLKKHSLFGHPENDLALRLGRVGGRIRAGNCHYSVNSLFSSHFLFWLQC